MVDRFGREINYLRLSVTDRCNLRCRYCMPESGICKKQCADMMTEEEMIQAVEAAAALGIKKVRITGGEPLVKKNILSICEKTAKIEGVEEVCLTTNGVLLSQFALSLKNAGVKRVNISLDTLEPVKFKNMTRIGEFADVWNGLLEALRVGFEKVKINTVLIGGFNDDEIAQLANLTLEYPVDVRFIELMPMYDGEEYKEEAFIPCSTVLDKVPDLMPLDKVDGVAKLYKLPNGKGNVGLISPVNAHFCGACNRLRITADGMMKPCLHSKEEISLKGRTFEEMKSLMKQAIEGKPACHGELSYYKRSESGRLMSQIGG